MALLLGVAAVNTGNGNLYLMVSSLLGFLIVSGLLGSKNLLELKVCLDFPEEIHDGRDVAVRIRLENRRRFLPAFLIQVELQESRTFFTALSPGEKRTATAVLRFSGRGIHHLKTVRIRSIFPVDFFLRWSDLPVDRRVIVFPMPRACAPIRFGKKGDSGDVLGLHRSQEGEISRIGDYRGEPLKFIHWKLSARQEELKIKELSSDTGGSLILNPDLLPGNGLEERLQHGAFLIEHSLRMKIPLGLQIGERTIPPAVSRTHGIRLLTELALYGTH